MKQGSLEKTCFWEDFRHLLLTFEGVSQLNRSRPLSSHIKPLCSHATVESSKDNPRQACIFFEQRHGENSAGFKSSQWVYASMMGWTWAGQFNSIWKTSQVPAVEQIAIHFVMLIYRYLLIFRAFTDTCDRITHSTQYKLCYHILTLLQSTELEKKKTKINKPSIDKLSMSS